MSFLSLHRAFGLFCCVAIFLPACSENPSARKSLSAEQKQEFSSRGDDLSDQLIKTLGGQLKAALAGGDPLNAVKVCQQVAQPLTSQISDETGNATVSRITLKPRNPVNAPEDSYDRELLDKWTALATKQAIPGSQLIPVDGTRVRYYRPLFIQEVCTKCHGSADSLEPELSALLDSLYPEDQAKGYRTGDFRGAIKVEFEQ